VTRRLLYGVLAALGLALYLWPAFSAPVVLWSDSAIDLEWARKGVGIFTAAPAPPSPHPAKPAFILFLRAMTAVAPDGASERWIVVAQSLLVWLAIAFAAWSVGRRFSPARGIVLYVALILFLRLRDASSAIMSEALSAALLLAIAAALLDPPRGAGRAIGLGAATALLFLIRPNVGAAAVALALLAWARERRLRPPLAFAGAFLALALPIWIATAPARDSWRGLSPAFTAAASDYGWLPAAGLPADATPTDVRRQFAWRALHGLLGTEFYDARWSPAYRRLTELSRALTPWLIVAAITALLVGQRNSRGPGRVLGLGLVAILLLQSFVLGALARFALPMLPALFLFAVAAPEPGLLPGFRRLAVVVAATLVAVVRWQRQALDWEWGLIESSGTRITQTIPAGSLPEHGPATLHVRIAAPLLPTDASFRLLGPAGEALYDSGRDSERRRPFITVALPESLLASNRNGATKVTLVSYGTYDATHYLLFPVVPAPWSWPAARAGSRDLSPASGVSAGALDWWAHAGPS
jgi:hypothetical protein